MAPHIRDWYREYVQSPNNPVDRAARWSAERIHAAVQKLVRGSVVLVRTVLALTLATVAAVGATLLAGVLGRVLIDEDLGRLLVILIAAVISEVALVGWFKAAGCLSCSGLKMVDHRPSPH